MTECALSRNGVPIRLTDERWAHIVEEHAELAGLCPEVLETIAGAERVFEIEPGEPVEPGGCICGDILRGVKTPPDCSLFRLVCNPENPVGPCMVSSEGSCSACYQYGDGYGG